MSRLPACATAEATAACWLRYDWTTVFDEVSLSTVAQIRAIASTASRGCAPAAVSADGITASVPASTVLATSVTSARVGR